MTEASPSSNDAVESIPRMDNADNYNDKNARRTGRTTVIIVTFNSSMVIKRCIERIPESVPIIVVDNCSTDDTLAIVATIEREITIVQQGVNSGYGKAANTGLSAVQTACAFLINPDTLISHDSINLLDTASRVFPDRPILAPAIIDDKGAITSKYERVDDKTIICEQEADLVQASGCALFFNLEAFKKLGFFDQAFFLYYEETDLCKRALNAGCPTRYVPVAHVEHLSGQSSGGGPRGNLLAHFEWSHCYYHRKHHNRYLEAIAIRFRLLKQVIKSRWYVTLRRRHKAIEYRWRALGTRAFLRGHDAYKLQELISQKTAPP